MGVARSQCRTVTDVPPLLRSEAAVSFASFHAMSTSNPPRAQRPLTLPDARFRRDHGNHRNSNRCGRWFSKKTSPDMDQTCHMSGE